MATLQEPGNGPNGWERYLDVARRWLTACGQGGCYFVAEKLADDDDEKLADKCIRGWLLDEPQGDDNDITWFEQHEADRQMLIEAFMALRIFFTSRPL
jgi:hypothetical protein